MITARPSGFAGVWWQAAAKGRRTSVRSARFMGSRVGLGARRGRLARALSAEARESWSRLLLVLELLDQHRQVLAVGLHVDLVEDLAHDALLVEHEGHALRVLAGRVEHAVPRGHAAVGVGEHRVGRLLLLRELGQ